MSNLSGRFGHRESGCHDANPKHSIQLEKAYGGTFAMNPKFIMERCMNKDLLDGVAMFLAVAEHKSFTPLLNLEWVGLAGQGRA
jgi:hypothetical protein